MAWRAESAIVLTRVVWKNLAPPIFPGYSLLSVHFGNARLCAFLMIICFPLPRYRFCVLAVAELPCVSVGFLLWANTFSFLSHVLVLHLPVASCLFVSDLSYVSC